MKNRTAVLTHTVAAIDAHASLLRQPLTLLLRSADPADRREAEVLLHDALVCQALGYEVGAADGATFKLRRTEAQAALDAWGEANYDSRG